MTDAETAQCRKWFALALLASTQFVIILDAAIVNVAIPSIGRDLRFSEENLMWIPNAYLPLGLTIIGAAGIASVLVTKLGFRPVLLGGLVLVTIGLLWFSRVPVDGVYVTDLLGPMLICAVGLGLAFVPVTIAAVTGVSADESGLASGSSTRHSRSVARWGSRSCARSPRRRRPTS